MGIDLPYGMAFWPMVIGGVVAGILIDSCASRNGYGNNPIIAIPVIAAAFGCGKVGGWIAGIGFLKCLGILGVIGVFGTIAFLILVNMDISPELQAKLYPAQNIAQPPAVHRNTAPVNPLPTNPLPTPAGYSPGTNSLRVGTMYHATPDFANAIDIFENRRFIVGPSTPLGFYLSPNFDWVAKEYGYGNGAIVEFLVAQDQLLKEKGNSGEIFYYHTPNANVGEYLDLPVGLIIVRVLDCNKNELRK